MHDRADHPSTQITLTPVAGHARAPGPCGAEPAATQAGLDDMPGSTCWQPTCGMTREDSCTMAEVARDELYGSTIRQPPHVTMGQDDRAKAEIARDEP